MVMRMEHDSLTKACMDWTDVGRLAGDRSGRNMLVKERTAHLEVYERQLGHEYVRRDGMERLARNERRVNEDLRCRYEGCERLCRSRTGFVRNDSMMHRRVEGRVRFVCEDCGLEVGTRGALVSHRRTCGAGGKVGGRAEGAWEVRGSCFLRELHPSRAVVKGGGGGSGYGRIGGEGWRRTAGGGVRWDTGWSGCRDGLW